ncbi:hypothetical protein KAI52_02540 [Candidatus Parcubacteria bacterium]|nr:hypothetical protein [Candidatus Parcubacteria bacterium]
MSNFKRTVKKVAKEQGKKEKCPNCGTEMKEVSLFGNTWNACPDCEKEVLFFSNGENKEKQRCKICGEFTKEKREDDRLPIVCRQCKNDIAALQKRLKPRQPPFLRIIA